MKTFFICLTLMISILGAAWILKPSPPPRYTDRLSTGILRETVEKALNEKSFLAQQAANKIEVKEIRTNDSGTAFGVYWDVYQKNGEIDSGGDILVRNEFGRWKFPNLTDVVFDLKEKQ